MNKELQELISHLSQNRNTTLTSILASADEETWEQNRHIIISTTPFLTLEMAINRIADNRKRASIPEPHLIYRAIKYASNRRKEYIKNTNLPQVERDNAA